jgi:hypothetical protein
VKNKALFASAAALVLLSAFLFAPVRQVAAAVAYSGMSIFDSVINSTTIGMTVPAAAQFTAVGATALSANTVTSNFSLVNGQPSSFSGANGYTAYGRNGTGDMDFVAANSGASPSFSWYFLLGTTATQEMSLNQAGRLIVPGVTSPSGIFGNLIAACNGCSGTAWNNAGFTSGSWISQGQEGGSNLETDLINLHPSANAGGFAWWSPTANAIGSPIMTLSTGGVLTISQVDGNATSATTAASTSGNAGTATSLAAPPSQCASGEFATGIQANGTANCTLTKTLWTNTMSVCTTPSGATGSCSTTLTWPSPGFSVSYMTVCQGYNMTGSGAIVNISVTAQTLTTVTVTLTSGTANQANAATFSEIVCEANGT